MTYFVDEHRACDRVNTDIEGRRCFRLYEYGSEDLTRGRCGLGKRVFDCPLSVGQNF